MGPKPTRTLVTTEKRLLKQNLLLKYYTNLRDYVTANNFIGSGFGKNRPPFTFKLLTFKKYIEIFDFFIRNLYMKGNVKTHTTLFVF